MVVIYSLLAIIREACPLFIDVAAADARRQNFSTRSSKLLKNTLRNAMPVQSASKLHLRLVSCGCKPCVIHIEQTDHLCKYGIEQSP